MRPSNVRSIWDAGDRTQDRYTIVLDEKSGMLFDCLCLDDQPTHPLGFSQFSTCREGDHLGARISWDQLPENVRQHSAERVS